MIYVIENNGKSIPAKYITIHQHSNIALVPPAEYESSRHHIYSPIRTISKACKAMFFLRKPGNPSYQMLARSCCTFGWATNYLIMNKYKYNINDINYLLMLMNAFKPPFSVAVLSPASSDSNAFVLHARISVQSDRDWASLPIHSMFAYDRVMRLQNPGIAFVTPDIHSIESVHLRRT